MKGESDMQKRMKQGKGLHGPAAIGIGIGVSVVSTVLGAALIAYFVHTQVLGQAAVKVWLMLVLMLSAAVGSIVSSAAIQEKRLVSGIASGVGYFGILILANALLFGGQFTGFWMSLLMVALGAAAAMLPVMHKKGGKRKYKIPAYR